MKKIKPKIKNFVKILTEQGNLFFVLNKKFQTKNLISWKNKKFRKIFSKQNSKDYFSEEKKLLELQIPTTAGGVNQGDRRLIFNLIRTFAPKSVLEIGTHIGASTAYIAAALKKSKFKKIKFMSVDCVDVNNIVTRPWLKYQTQFSPQELINEINCNNIVKFKIQKSQEFLNNCKIKFDFIFLDGDHSAVNVYKELYLALKLLNKNGIILLHDYFHDLKPLWADNSVIPGPYLAVKKIIQSGCNLKVIAFGKLPWKTKLNSHVTSLAIIAKKPKIIS